MTQEQIKAAEENNINIKELQIYLGVGRDLAYQLVRTKGFPARKIGRRWYMKKNEIDKWWREHQNTTFNHI